MTGEITPPHTLGNTFGTTNPNDHAVRTDKSTKSNRASRINRNAIGDRLRVDTGSFNGPREAIAPGDRRLSKYAAFHLSTCRPLNRASNPLTDRSD